MRLPSAVIVALSFIAGAAVCVIAAGFLATAVEDTTERAIREAMTDKGHDWTQVRADGLRVVLSGTAPTEAARFSAGSTARTLVDPSRVIDAMDTAPSNDLNPPRFSAEILRNASGISLIGLVPRGMDRAGLVDQLSDIAQVSDLLDAADYPVPEGWNEAVKFTAFALDKLPRSKVSVEAGRVEVTAIADSPDAKRRLENTLKKAVPGGLIVRLDITAPRPVITPFTLRYLIDDNGARFDACSADTEQARARILAAANAAGGNGGASCVLGLGVPSPKWAEAAALGISKLAEIGKGSITFADADITLVAAEGTPSATFDRVVGELQAALPRVFALHAVLPVAEGQNNAGPPEFTATLSPEGLVQLRGRLNDETMQRMADAYAKARFGSSSVYSAARTAEDLPADWPIRVLSGIEALSRLSNGVVSVTPEAITVRGISHDEDAQATIAGFLSDRLGDAKSYSLDITYEAPPPPADEPMTPEMCESQIAEVQRSTGKITFEPGSATIAASSLDTMNAIATILSDCGEIRLEIQGHTDSQGRESMNQALSQDRAQTVLNELRSRRVLTSTYTAKGYGESVPIAENDTEEGREANRRIEFRLIQPGTSKEIPTTLESVAQQGTTGADGTEDDAGQGEEAVDEEAATDEASGDEGSGDGEPGAEEEETTNEQN